MRSVPSRFSNWVLVHPIGWGVGAAVALVLLGLAFDAPPIAVLAAGAVVGMLNVVHARRRSACALQPEPDSHPTRSDAG
ncbi:hypothetical protein ACE2AJ_01285 [Aquihabitans daechungensis]|uniref:hypothetical protein n=1 Tax=Aquihabitans daechungensis TaxID=1052257 RepID=UPI003BA2DBD5